MASGRSVFETGEFDYAWNLQLAPDVLAKMDEGGKGVLVSAFGTLVERIMINMTNPDPALGDERATAAHPHPFLSDFNVRKALSMAIDRALLVEIGYGSAGRLTCNVLPAPAIYASSANDACKVQDIAGANKILDDAGWVRGADGIRSKDGVRLSMLYQTSTNAVRQDFQALIKQWWQEIGVETELRNINASVFFGGDAGSPDTYQKFLPMWKCMPITSMVLTRKPIWQTGYVKRHRALKPNGKATMCHAIVMRATMRWLRKCSKPVTSMSGRA